MGNIRSDIRTTGAPGRELTTPQPDGEKKLPATRPRARNQPPTQLAARERTAAGGTASANPLRNAGRFSLSRTKPEATATAARTSTLQPRPPLQRTGATLTGQQIRQAGIREPGARSAPAAALRSGPGPAPARTAPAAPHQGTLSAAEKAPGANGKFRMGIGAPKPLPKTPSTLQQAEVKVAIPTLQALPPKVS